MVINIFSRHAYAMPITDTSPIPQEETHEIPERHAD